jgi:hypothetical protein
VTIPQITAQARGPLAATAHEVGCGPSPDQVRVYVSCNRVRNLPYLYGGSAHYKGNSPNSIEGIGISSRKIYINKARLDTGFLLSRGPKPV